MSNVSDTNEIVAVRLLFPLARTFLIGGASASVSSIFTSRMTARTYGRFDWRAKALALSEHLYQRPKYVVRPRNVPKRCNIGNNG